MGKTSKRAIVGLSGSSPRASVWLQQGLAVSHSVRAPPPPPPWAVTLPCSHPLCILHGLFLLPGFLFPSLSSEKVCPNDVYGSFQPQSSLSLSCPIFQ